MTVFLYAMVTVVSWGTWIGVSQLANARSDELRTLYVTVGALVLALAVLLGSGEAAVVPWHHFWPSFLGGLVWALGNFSAFVSTSNIGIAKAAGTWTPLNVAMGFLWGTLLFGEFQDASTGKLGLLGVAIAVVVAGLLLIVSVSGADNPTTAGGADNPTAAGGTTNQTTTMGVKNRTRGRDLAVGFAGAVGAGVFWGSYFVPGQLAGTSPWVANVPLAAGMTAGGLLMVALRRNRPALPRRRDYAILLAAGGLWGIGNLGMLLLIEEIGTGRGFTIAQLSLLVNAVMGVYLFRDPPPRSRAALMTLCGVVVAGAGGVLLGNLK